MCKLDEVVELAGAWVGSGMAVGAGPESPEGVAVGWVTGADVAVAEEPQAMMSTNSTENSTAGFLRMRSFMD